MATEGLSLYKNYAIRKELIERGIREKLTSWVLKLQSNEAEDYRKYLLAGFKDVDLVEELVNNEIPVDIASEIKKKFRLAGMKETELEQWLKLVLILFDESWVIFLYQEGYSLGLAEMILESEADGEKIERKVQLLSEQIELSEKDIFWEVYLYRMLFDVYDLSMLEPDEWHKANELDLHSICLYRFYKEHHKELGIKAIKSKKNFYVKALGLKELEAEWWIVSELAVKKELGLKLTLDGFDIENIKKWKSAGVKTFEDIYKVSYLMLDNPDLSVDELIKWWKTDIPYQDVNKWKKHGIEQVIKMREIGVGQELEPKLIEEMDKIDLDEFKKLLDETLCDPEELFSWLFLENFDTERIREWLKLGVLDSYTYNLLKKRGFTLERLKDLLQHFSLKSIFQKVEEGASYEDIKTEYLKNKTASAFKKKLKLAH